MAVWQDGCGGFYQQAPLVAHAATDADAASAAVYPENAGRGPYPAVTNDGDGEHVVPRLGSTLATAQHTPTVICQPDNSARDRPRLPVA